MSPRTRIAAIAHDWRAALKNHARRPAFLVTAALMLAAGLGFNTALFAVVKAVLLHPLPYREPSRVMMLWTGRWPDGQGAVTSYADFADWKATARSFDALASYNISLGTIRSGGGDPEEIGGATVGPDFFRVLGVRPEAGRLLDPDDYGPPTELGRPLVISHRLWQQRFGLSPAALGQIITLADRPRRIVGVLPADFVQPEPFWGVTADYWSPQILGDEARALRASRFLRVIARLGPGVTIEQARAEMDTIGRGLMARWPATNERSVVLAPVADELVGDTRPLLLLYLGAAALVLALAMANIVNLLLARAAGRRMELALRAALGASRGRIISQLVAESAIAGLAGGMAGLGLAAIGLRLLRAYAPFSVPGLDRLGIDAGVAAFAVVLSVATGAVCAMLPAWRFARPRLSSSLAEMRVTADRSVTRGRRWLVAVEVALAVPLVVGAALLTATLVKMQRVDPGFDAAHALQFRINPTGARYDAPGARATFFADLLARLDALPGVDATGIVSSLPLGGLNNTGASIVYEKPDGSLAQQPVGFRAATSGYFAALGIPVRRGALYADSAWDTGRVVINERAARLMWGGANPIGRRIRFGLVTDTTPQPWLTIGAVVGDVRHDGLTREPNAEIFQPYAANPASPMTIVARTSGDPAGLIDGARRLVRETDPAIAVVNPGTASMYIDGQLARPRFGVVCAVTFGGLAIALAAFGIFAVLSVLVSHRTREIGVRMALGASPAKVGGLVVRDSLVPASIGGAAGALAAAWLARGLTSQLFGVTPLEPLAFAAAIAMLVIVAAAASWWPARRAMRVDPVRALRAD